MIVPSTPDESDDESSSRMNICQNLNSLHTYVAESTDRSSETSENNILENGNESEMPFEILLKENTLQNSSMNINANSVDNETPINYSNAFNSLECDNFISSIDQTNKEDNRQSIEEDATSQQCSVLSNLIAYYSSSNKIKFFLSSLSVENLRNNNLFLDRNQSTVERIECDSDDDKTVCNFKKYGLYYISLKFMQNLFVMTFNHFFQYWNYYQR